MGLCMGIAYSRAPCGIHKGLGLSLSCWPSLSLVMTMQACIEPACACSIDVAGIGRTGGRECGHEWTGPPRFCAPYLPPRPKEKSVFRRTTEGGFPPAGDMLDWLFRSLGCGPLSKDSVLHTQPFLVAPTSPSDCSPACMCYSVFITVKGEVYVRDR